eukprot:5332632-Prymnesium_polylepis.1
MRIGDPIPFSKGAFINQTVLRTRRLGSQVGGESNQRVDRIERGRLVSIRIDLPTPLTDLKKRRLKRYAFEIRQPLLTYLISPGVQTIGLVVYGRAV